MPCVIYLVVFVYILRVCSDVLFAVLNQRHVMIHRCISETHVLHSFITKLSSQPTFYPNQKLSSQHMFPSCFRQSPVPNTYFTFANDGITIMTMPCLSPSANRGTVIGYLLLVSFTATQYLQRRLQLPSYTTITFRMLQTKLCANFALYLINNAN